MTNFSQIVSLVVAATGRSDKQAVIESLANDEITAVCREHNFYFMEEVVGRMLLVDQHKYALPSDFKDWGEVTLLEQKAQNRGQYFFHKKSIIKVKYCHLDTKYFSPRLI